MSHRFAENVRKYEKVNVFTPEIKTLLGLENKNEYLHQRSDIETTSTVRSKV